ncbi:MAG TPA: MBL fold metallo-hydrolase [Kofleriaceae bacterium]|nr:MBL fold metallo-hydrolase [Kofleriaceae bacterium]
MSKTLLASVIALAAVAAPAAADTKLTATPYTATPTGFLVNSTLVSGEKEAILIDGQFSLADAHRLVAVIMESKKTLTTVYVTHSHPDHYFGLNVIKQAFPKVKIVATPAVVKEIQASWKGKVKQWGPMYGALVPTQPVIPTPLKGTTLTLEGQTLEIKQGVGDAPDTTYVWIPSIKTVVAGDIVFRGVHPWTAEGKAEGRKAWIKTLDEISALNPEVVIAGHKDPKLDDKPAGVKQTRDYLEAFDAAVASSKSAAEVQEKMKKKYGDLQLDVILQIGAGAQFPQPAATK